MYNLDVFGKLPSRAFILIFTPVPKESNKKVLHAPLKMTILSPFAEISSRSYRLKLISTPNPEIHSV